MRLSDMIEECESVALMLQNGSAEVGAYDSKIKYKAVRELLLRARLILGEEL